MKYLADTNVVSELMNHETRCIPSKEEKRAIRFMMPEQAIYETRDFPCMRGIAVETRDFPVSIPRPSRFMGICETHALP